MSSLGSIGSGINFTGVSSGIDTDSIVAKLLQVDRIPETTISQQQAIANQRKALIQNINTKLLAVRDAATALKDITLFSKTPTVQTSTPGVAGAKTTPGAPNPIAGGYTLNTTQLARNEVQSQAGAFTTATSADTLRLSVNTWNGTTVYDVAVAAGATPQDISNSINQANIPGVSADIVSGKLRLSSAGDVTVLDGDTSNAYNVASDLGMAVTQTHNKATFTIDGTAYQRDTNNAITDALPGVTLDLLSVGGATVTVSNPVVNEDAVVAKVKAYVDSYNAAQSAMRSAITEKKITVPQSDADRLKGVLQNDSALNKISLDLRSAMMNTVGGLPSSNNLFAQIGISTAASTGVSNASANAGTLNFDETKFRAAIESNPPAVKDLLSRTGIVPNGSDSGLGDRISKLVTPYTSSTGVLGSKMAGYDNQVKTLQARFDRIESAALSNQARNKAKFLAMETLISSLHQSSAAFSGSASTSSTG
jgi:flagellar hook-associated protein 2